MKKFIILALTALAWAPPLGAKPLPSSVPPGAPSAATAEYSLPEGRFSVKPPAGWSASRDPREDERQKAYGVLLSGPRSADGVLSTMSITYYAPGNSLFKGGAEEFLKRNLGGGALIVPPAGETTGPVEKSTVGGLSAQRFTRHSHEYIPPDHTDSKEVAVVEEIEVASAKAGFYVIEFKSSEQLAKTLGHVYARVRASVRFAAAKDVP
ncbi:MAG: hypothetical protein ACHQ2Z_09790 [Elusimicrobiota bacterium]